MSIVAAPKVTLPAPLRKVLNSPWFWGAVVTLIMYFIFRKRIAAWYTKLTTPDRGNYDGHAGINASDGARIEQIARDLYSAIYSINWIGDPRQKLISQVLAMNDTEISYLAEFYSQLADSNTLYQDIDDEGLGLIDEDEQLMAKLRQLNLI